MKKKDGEMALALERTQDILAWVGEHKPEKLFVCGFSMETRDLIENSTAKLHKKQMDMIVANNLKVPGAGFGVDTNVVTLITGRAPRHCRCKARTRWHSALPTRLQPAAEVWFYNDPFLHIPDRNDGRRGSFYVWNSGTNRA